MYIVKKVRILSETATVIVEYSDFMAIWVEKGISCRAFLKSKEVRTGVIPYLTIRKRYPRYGKLLEDFLKSMEQQYVHHTRQHI